MFGNEYDSPGIYLWTEMMSDEQRLRLQRTRFHTCENFGRTSSAPW